MEKAMIFLTRFTSALVLLSCAAFSAQGDIIVQHAPPTQVVVNGEDRWSSSVPLATSFVADGIEATPLTQVGLDSFTSAFSWPVGRWSAGFDAGKYVSVTITPDPGSIINYEDVVWDKGFFSSVVDDGTIRTSLDSFATDLTTGVDAGGVITFDLSSLTNVTSPIEFRFYFTGDGGFSDLDTSDAPGLTFNGEVVPEPGSLALLGLGGALVFRRRRCA
ncbi:MAG: PEP-CTERM sorting domain-containing protein [Planctomycetota bacterium]